MKIERTIREAYGNSFGFSGGTFWASAATGLVHVWNNFELISSYEIPGFESGNVFFENDFTLQVGLFEINITTKEKSYKASIAEQFALFSEAHYSQYRIDEVVHAENDLTLVAVSRQLSRGYKKEEVFIGPTNRLLLFNRKTSELVKRIAENEESAGYSSLLVADDRIIYSVNNTCFLAEKNDGEPSGFAVQDFIPMYYSHHKNWVAGSFQNQSLQLRNSLDLSLVWQAPGSYTTINKISGWEDMLVAAVNDNIVQAWHVDDKEPAKKDEIKLDGFAEGVAVTRRQLCFVAIAGSENKLVVLSVN